MRPTALAVSIIAVALLLAGASTQADVRSINLMPVGGSGVSGTATIIAGEISGANPYYDVETNALLNRMPSANMVYEGWLIDNDTGYRLSLGAFDGMRLSAKMRLLHFEGSSPYDAVAVSLEPARDKNPLPATIVAMGSLPGSIVSAEDFQRVAIVPGDEMFLRRLSMQRFGLSDELITDLRMRGYDYQQIAVVVNAAARANRPPDEIASMRSQGQSWDQIASAFGTTVAFLMEPMPAEAVAGYRVEMPPGAAFVPGTIQPPVVYHRYPNGRPIVTSDLWNRWWKAGYSWRDVAVAANIASITGENVPDLLRMVRIQGRTWRQIAIDRALDVDAIMDVSGWPFGEEGGEAVMIPPPPPGQPSY